MHNYLLTNRDNLRTEGYCVFERDCEEISLVVTDSEEKACKAFQENKPLIILEHNLSMDEFFPPAQCYIQNLDICEDEIFLEQMCQRKLSLPWKIAEDEEIFLREMSLQDLSRIPEGIRPSEGEAKSYIETMYNIWGFGIWLIIRKSDGEILGKAGLGTREASGSSREEYLYDLGYEILPEYRCMGYGKRAAGLVIEYAKQELLINRLALYVAKDNEASIRLARSLGFEVIEKDNNEIKMIINI